MSHGWNTTRPSRNREDRWLATVFSAAERRRIVARGESSNPWFSGRFIGRPEGSAHRYPYPSSRGSRTHRWLQSVAAPRLQSTDCCCYFLCMARKYRMLVERSNTSLSTFPRFPIVPNSGADVAWSVAFGYSPRALGSWWRGLEPMESGFRIRMGCGLLAGVLAILIGCMPSRQCAPPLSVTSRDWVDLSASPGAYARMDPGHVKQVLAQFSDEPAPPGGPRYEALVLSGGGMYGAYTAGVLVGWSTTGTRPKFDCVTGVSTGALIATLAFLGPEHDESLRTFATTVNAGRIYRTRQPISVLWSPSVASPEPLEKLINSVTDMNLLRAVAKGHAEGRRLFVGTTNLDARRLVVWDMGEIATRGDAEALTLFRKILLASCAIPGFFPPVSFDVEVDGKKYTELHVDGGASASLFLRL